jgi:hypothetical protein
MKYGFTFGAAVLFALTLVRPADAFTMSDGIQFPCIDYRGQEATEIPVDAAGLTRQNFTGVTQAGQGMAPSTITWAMRKLNSLPPPMHDFIFFHECGHAKVPTLDELNANCRGLIDMRQAGRSSPQIEQQLAAFHAALGFMGQQYGMGDVYWANTVRCANSSSADPPVTPVQDATMPAAQPAPPMTLRCFFRAGPLAGRIFDFSGQPGARPAPVGSFCTDGIMSSGVAVP